MDEETTAEEKQEVLLPLITHVNHILHSFSSGEVYVNNQEIYNSYEVYAQRPYISNKFKRAISEYKGVLHCEVYDYEEFHDEIVEMLLSERFFTKRMKMLCRPDGFILYGKLGLTFLDFLIAISKYESWATTNQSQIQFLND